MADRRASLLAIHLLLSTILLGCRTSPPRVSIPAGNYICPQMVSLTDSAANASIFYTSDGTTPQPSSPKYATPITVSNTDTLKAIAVAPPLKPSKVTSAQYTCTQIAATRRDFAVLLQKTFRLPPPQQSTDFPDLSSADRDYAAIQAAAPFTNLQILCRGCMLSVNFGPDTQISRAGSAISIVGVLAARNQLGLVSIAESNKILSSVADVDDIPVAARSHFATAIKAGILTLSPDRKILLHTGYTPPEITALLETVGKQYGYSDGSTR